MPTYAAMAVGPGGAAADGADGEGQASGATEDAHGNESGEQSWPWDEDRGFQEAEHYDIASETAESWYQGSRPGWRAGDYDGDYAGGTWRANENWSWSGSQNGWSSDSWSSSRGEWRANWEWVERPDPWREWYQGHDAGWTGWRRDQWRDGVRGQRQGVCHGDGPGEDLRQDGYGTQGDVRGHGRDSPRSIGAARDISGELPSGESSGVGHRKEMAVAGDRRGKISSSYPPIFRAKPGESFREWKRSVDFWLGGEANQIPPELIGPRLMVQLRDRAGQLVHHLTNADVNGADGMKVIMQVLERSPIIRQLDRHKVDQHRKKLMSLKRLPAESIESYVTRGSIYRTQLQALDNQMEMGECFYTGLLLDGARLTRKDKIMIKTKAGSDFEEITNAMIDLAPELEGESGFPIGGSEPNIAAKQGDEFLVQRNSENFVKKGRDTLMVEDPGPWDESHFGSIPEEDEEVESLPPEVLQAENEAFAMQFKARQKIAEVKKLRQYFRKPETSEERRRAIQEKMKTAPCHKCGELGHWSRECPQRANGANLTMAASKTKADDGDWAALAALCHRTADQERREVYMVHSGGGEGHVHPCATLWCQSELKRHVIVYLGCVRSVVGLEWMNDLVEAWKRHDRWLRVWSERETFQFGNGEQLISRYRVEFEALIGGHRVVLGMSVVDGSCPPLLSRHACSQLGMQTDCGAHAFSSHRLKVRNYGFSRASNGHYLLPIEPKAGDRGVELPDDFRLERGTEAFIIPHYAADIGLEADKDSLEAHGLSGFYGMDRMQTVREPRTRDQALSIAGGDRRDGSGRGEAFTATPSSRDSTTGAAGTIAGAPHHYWRLRGEGGAQLPGGVVLSDPGGAEDDRAEPGEAAEQPDEGQREEGADWDQGGLPQPVPHVQFRGGDEHGLCDGEADANLLVEEVAVADAGEESSGGDAAGALEAQSALAGNAAGQGGGLGLRPLRGNEAEAPRPSRLASHVKTLQRGEVQRLKKGVLEARRVNRLLHDTAGLEGRFVVLELFAGSATLTKVAGYQMQGHWCALEPVDILTGYDLTKKSCRDKVWDMIRRHKPDLITCSMPCKPWCNWMHLLPSDEVEQRRSEAMPLWRFVREVWDHQVSEQRLVLTENPWASEGLKLTFMMKRPQLHRVKLAQCQFGLVDKENGKPHQKLTALDVNDPTFARALERGAQCTHQPEDHQRLEGQVFWEGRRWNRTALASIWPEPLCRHILGSAETTLRETWPINHQALHAECAESRWETAPVRSGDVPEERLRQEMNALGQGTDRYGYITFEGEGQAVPRRVRASVAHLHSALGHLNNDRLVKMLVMSGAGEQVLTAARNLHCQICAMIQPPRDTPQAAYGKPGNFNERISGDSFFVWDAGGTKYGVVHFVDALTDYHIADATLNPSSAFVVDLLRGGWYGVFGPPDVMLTDGGREFCGVLETLNDIFGVVHEIIPDGAKWRLGQAERHGAILKIMIMKMVASHELRGVDDMRMAATAAVGAKNRLLNEGGCSPLQAVTGKNTMIPSSLMDQISSTKVKFVVNQEIDRESCLRRAERIRQAAVEAFMWLDAHKTLRRALHSKSRPPRLELIREGALVYIYDPPANRRGLSRRIQDNASWSGPGVVVCVERDRPVPNKIWVRVRGRLRTVPLERVRLATADEAASGTFIKEALDEVQKGLDKGVVRVEPEGEEIDEPEELVEQPGESGGNPGGEASSSRGVRDGDDMEEVETDRMRMEKRLLQDVPLTFRREDDLLEKADPSTLKFRTKKRIFENLAKQLEPPSLMQEVKVRHELERSLGRAVAQHQRRGRAVSAERRPSAQQKDSKKRPGSQPGERTAGKSLRVGDTLIVQEHPEEQAIKYELGGGRVSPGTVKALTEFYEQIMPVEKDVADVEMEDVIVDELDNYVDLIDKDSGVLPHGVCALDEVLLQKDLWTAPSTQARPDQLQMIAAEKIDETKKVLKEGELVTGKQRLEYTWSALGEEWKKAYVEPIKKAYRVYIEHDAIAGVPLGAVIDPKKILPSRLVLTNKGGRELEEAVLKARWIFGGHRDPEAGKYLTASPTVSLVGHNLLVFLAVQLGWEVIYEDVSAAFLQGKELPAEREVYVRIPSLYPESTLEPLHKVMTAEHRQDILKLTKGGFGLPESPRLWYLEYKSTLEQLGGREMRLLPGFFTFHQGGRLIGMACIHVDDTRYAGAPEAAVIWQRLHDKLNFGAKRKATEGWAKFCGRFERQEVDSMEMVYSMKDYCRDIPLVEERKAGEDHPLTQVEKKMIASVIGQINWAARQCRYDLSFGASHASQLAGRSDPTALMWVNRVVRRAQQELEVRVPRLGCAISEMVVLSISDASYAGQPGGASQGGLLIALAHPDILSGEAPLAVIEGMSGKLQRVVRCSMAAELSQAALAYEHGDYVRAVLSEIMQPHFSLKSWKFYASHWRHVLVLDAKVAYDAIQSETAPTDRKLIVDIAILREALTDPEGQGYIRWVPGREIPGDGLTKWHANGILERILQNGMWALTDTPEARALRQRAAMRKKMSKPGTAQVSQGAG